MDSFAWRSRSRCAAWVAALSVFFVVVSGSASTDTEEGIEGLAGELRVTGMTFVGSRGDVTEFVLRARQALLRPQTNIAHLEDVRVNGVERDEAEGFAMSCERGELNIETNDFLAEGDVHGTTSNGRTYMAPWVRYDHDKALLYTDAPATMRDSTGTFSGDGFRYHLKEDRFRLLGNVKVVQE